jgi:hypothetical protein
MKMKIFDTDIIIDYLKGIEEAKECLGSTPQNERCLTSITFMELLWGARNKKEIVEIKEFVYLNFKEVVHIDEISSRKAVELIERYAKSHGLEIADALIAAIAMTKTAIVHTGNIDDFLYIEELEAKGVPYK